MTETIDHVLLTRFNLPSGGAESTIRARSGWLRDRVALFERYCLPSVAAQDEPAFTWIVYFDPESPEWLKERILAWTETAPFVALFRTGVTQSELIADVRDITGGRSDYLMTTNLDNDDAVASDFVRRLQAVESTQWPAAIYLSQGLIKRGGDLYRREDPTNAFCSVRATWSDPTTCWAEWHNLLGDHMPVIAIPGAPGWLQVVHDRNVSNRVRGKLVGPLDYENLFANLLNDVSVPSRMALLRDIVWNVPVRTSKEAVRAVVKRVTVRLAGKDGLDRLKGTLQVIRR